MISLDESRRQLVEWQLRRRGIVDPRVLRAFESVRREAFLPAEMAEFAYRDTALPIEKGQTISQPFIVALMTEAAELQPTDRVLEVGTGSGYAAAILGKVAGEVYTIERHEELASQAARRLAAEGFANVHVKHGDGTLGWPEHGPFDAILVAAGGPEPPQPLLDQLAIGGRLVIPVGAEQTEQKLVRIRRVGPSEFRHDDLGAVRFVPLIGARGWQDGVPPTTGEVETARRRPSPKPLVSELVRETAEPLDEIRGADCGPLIERIGDSRLVLIGEATHGTSEFYRMRAEISKELIQRGAIQFVAIEGDWPDVARIDAYVRGVAPRRSPTWQAFSRFPTWMWRNEETLEFVEWLRVFNRDIAEPERRVGFHGLDLYSAFTSIRAVLEYLGRVDPRAAEAARLRYGCLTPWESDPALYGRLAVGGRHRVCEKEAVAILQDLLRQRLEYFEHDGMQFFDAVQNARLVANAERYYRAMYYGGHESWNLRDTHMFETLQTLLGWYGDGSRAVVWEHNSHLGDAAHTQMGASGQLNVGQLCREAYGPVAYLIGQGTDHGTVAAATDWDAAVESMNVRPAHPASYESVFHESQIAAFRLPLRDPPRRELREELASPRLERAIGVVYRPQTEMASHYFEARLPSQFDEFIWFDATQAVRWLRPQDERSLPPDHPFSWR